MTYDPMTYDNFWYEEYQNGQAPMKYGDVSIIPKYGRMEPNIIIHVKPGEEKIQFSNTPFGNIIADGKLSWVEGKFWVDKGNSEIHYFHPKLYKPEHVLVRVEWSRDDETMGHEWDTYAPLAIHSKRCISKSGKYGINWYVFAKNFVYKDAAMIAAIEEEFGKLPIVEPNYIEEK